MRNIIIWLFSCASGETEYELVPISAHRWPATVRTELAGVSVFLIFPGSKALPHQAWGLRQVGLWPEEVKPGLGRNSLTSAEGWLWKWVPDCYLEWALFGYTNSLSNTTKLILLDSLLQEVCIESGSQPWVRSGWLSSQKFPFFRTNESPLTQTMYHPLPMTTSVWPVFSSRLPCWLFIYSKTLTAHRTRVLNLDRAGLQRLRGCLKRPS